jgi:hypothetical protein
VKNSTKIDGFFGFFLNFHFDKFLPKVTHRPKKGLYGT